MVRVWSYPVQMNGSQCKVLTQISVQTRVCECVWVCLLSQHVVTWQGASPSFIAYLNNWSEMIPRGKWHQRWWSGAADDGGVNLQMIPGCNPPLLQFQLGSASARCELPKDERLQILDGDRKSWWKRTNFNLSFLFLTGLAFRDNALIKWLSQENEPLSHDNKTTETESSDHGRSGLCSL